MAYFPEFLPHLVHVFICSTQHLCTSVFMTEPISSTEITLFWRTKIWTGLKCCRLLKSSFSSCRNLTVDGEFLKDLFSVDLIAKSVAHRKTLVGSPGLIIVIAKGVHSSLTNVHYFDNGYMGKQPVAWIEYCHTGYKNSREVWIDALAAAINM